MVADAVAYEPVSSAESLLTGKLTGKFSVSARFAEAEREIRQPNSKAYNRIPCESEQGILQELQGIALPEQGLNGDEQRIARLEIRRDRSRNGECRYFNCQ